MAVSSCPGVVVLFGPQCPEIDGSLYRIRNCIAENPSANFLIDILDELPSFWPRIVDAMPTLSRVSGKAQLTSLRAFFRGGPLSAIAERPTNVVLTTLTVVSHVVDYLQHQEILEKSFEVRDTQGLCVGFLAAIAVALSHDKAEFQAVVSTIVLLAVCIGALVDLDELTFGHAKSIAVRWKTQDDYQRVLEVLASYSSAYISCFLDTNRATVTIPEDQFVPLMKDLFACGILAKTVNLRGRFHHEDHIPAVKQILKLCEQDRRFQLPHISRLMRPLRSNASGEAIKKGVLHTVALESILTKPAQWFLTVSDAIKSMLEVDRDFSIISIGKGHVVPQVARGRLIEPRSCRDCHNNENNTHRLANGYIAGNGIALATDERPETPDSSREAATAMPIAVTGIACRYPRADWVEQLWQILDSGQCAVTEIPNDRLKMAELRREPKGQFWGNFLARPDLFDHRFFGISGREAESMDPQQRLLLQVAYEAMESAGYCGLRTAELPRDVGCYVGVGSDDYTDNVGSHHANAFSATGTLQAFNSGRISHYFGWSGPSVTIDTACSSAAVAIHLACKALQGKDCSIAMAGGVNVMTSPKVTQNLAAASFLSPTGASKAFDADADGYCRGEGAGLVLLRPLEDAIQAGDPILAVITGSAVNQGANCSPITVPDSNSQKCLYLKALAAAGIRSEDVSYVEAHGTGTQVGDPIEFDSIRRTFGGPHRTDALYLGSIKDNIGHTETSSGVAALLKTILMMQKRRIPKQANFTRLNPKIPCPDDNKIVIPKRSVEWTTSTRRVAMVTNYGASGSNAALVVREYTPQFVAPDQPSAQLPMVPIFIAAKSAESVRDYCRRLRALFSQALSPDMNMIRDAAYNLAFKQNRRMDRFVAFSTMTGNAPSFLDQLESIASGTMDIKRKRESSLPVILCFGGQNGNTASISQELFHSCLLLKSHLLDCERACQSLGLPSLFPAIFMPDPISDIVSLHCILFSIQYASAKCWLDSGLHVDRMIGHSFGQLTALCVAGGLSLLDAVRLISHRARLVRQSWGLERGVMLAVECSKEELQMLLQHVGNAVDVACYNGPRSFVLAGDEASIQSIEILADHSMGEIRMKRLLNTHAYHSRMVDSIIPGLTEVAEALQYLPTVVPVEACSEDGDWSCVNSCQIIAHSRNAVYFQSAVERLVVRLQGPAVWVEVGTGSPIIPMVRRVVETSLSSVGHVYQPIDLRGHQALESLTKATCALWSSGVQVQFWPFHRNQTSAYNWINLPPYQFAQSSHWIDYDPYAFHRPPISSERSQGSSSLVTVLNKSPDQCLFAVNPEDPIYLVCTRGHAVANQSLCPASLYFEIVLRGVSALSAEEITSAMPQYQKILLSAPLVLNPQGKVFLRLTKNRGDSLEWRFSLFTQEEQRDPVTHATGDVSLHAFGSTSPALARFRSLDRLLDSSRADSITTSPKSDGLKRSAVYQVFRKAVNYSDYYRGVQEVFTISHEAAGRVELGSSRTKDSLCDPILIDNFIQVAGIHVNCLSGLCEDEEVFVCNEVGEVMIGELLMKRDSSHSASWTVYSNYSCLSRNQVTCDIFAMDRQTGNLALYIMGTTFTSVSIRSLRRTLGKLNNDPTATHSSSQPMQNDVGTMASLAPTRTLASTDNRFQLLQNMLCDLLGVSVDELPPTGALTDIGVDSLMSTEVLREIRQRFNVEVSMSELAGIPDLRGLVERIFPGTLAVESMINHCQPAGGVEVVVGSSPAHDKVCRVEPVIDERSVHVDVACKIFAKLRAELNHSREAQWLSFCESVYPKQMALVTAYVLDAFQAMGLSIQSLHPGQAVPQIPVLSQHERVLQQLYAVLEHSNLISQTGSGMVRTKETVPTVSTSFLHEDIVDQYPWHASEHRLLKTTGSKLAECLVGNTDPLSLLFQDSEARSLIEDVYTNAPMFKSATMHLTQYLKEVLIQYGPSREISILEVGAGTGGTTKYLLSQLAAVSGLRFRYTFTDLSPSLVALARQKFKMYSFMQYRTLNVEQCPIPELLGQYDIVLSSNCIHATRDLANSCANIRKLLRPDGILCLVELTRNLFWFDLVFGLLEGWWLFDDGRKHALASVHIWEESLHLAGYKWVDWTCNDSPESKILRVIVASPTRPSHLPEKVNSIHSLPVREETVVFAEKDGLQLHADIYYPENIEKFDKRRPIALMIHGGGHIMLSRKDIRPRQTLRLLESGFLPVSIDYRLCPETSIVEGPMHDVRDALAWARQSLPTLALKRADIRPDGNQVVAVGWSTGGHLAMTLAWTATDYGIRPPEAILSFYSPTNYTDPFWSRPNFPFTQDVSPLDVKNDNIWEGMRDTPITSYNPPASKRPLGGWMSPSDPRSRIALHMNWKGQTLSVLLHGWNQKKKGEVDGGLPTPTAEEIQRICPFSQIVAGHYKTPTFLVHGALDDLIPADQAKQTHNKLIAHRVEAELRIVNDALHLFDLSSDFLNNQHAVQAVADGYDFLLRHVTF